MALVLHDGNMHGVCQRINWCGHWQLAPTWSRLLRFASTTTKSIITIVIVNQSVKSIQYVWSFVKTINMSISSFQGNKWRANMIGARMSHRNTS